jgi:hypothetical protein
MERPVFVVGPPRSGTTLLMECLNRHPAVSVAPETNFLTAFHGERRWIDLEDPAAVRSALARLFGQGYGIGEWAHLRPEVEARFLARRSRGWAGLFEDVGRSIAEARGKERWGEKTPGHVRFLPELLALFPGARIVGTWRRPEAVVSSFLAREDLHDEVDRVVWELRWARRAYRRAGGELLVVEYEALVEDPEAGLARVAEHVGVDVHPAMARPDVDTSSYGPARDGRIRRGERGLSTASVDAWRQRLDPGEAARVAALVDGSAGAVASARYHASTARAWAGWAARKAGCGGMRRRLGRRDGAAAPPGSSPGQRGGGSGSRGGREPGSRDRG